MKIAKRIGTVSLAGLLLFASSCEKENVVKQTTLSNESETSEIAEGETVMQSRSTDQLYAAIAYQTLPSMGYLIQQRDPANGSMINTNVAFYTTGTGSSSLTVAGTIATDGTNFFGTDYNGNTYYAPIGSNSNPNSSSPMTFGGSVFVPDEIEYIGGDVYAITKAGGALYKLNGITTATTTVTSVGPFFGSAKYDFNRKSIYRNPTSNTMHLVHGVTGSPNSVKHYTVNTTTGAATLTNTYTGITFNSTSNFSAYHNGTDLYVLVQDTPAFFYSSTSWTLYQITSGGTITNVGTGNYQVTGDYAYIP